MKIFDTIKLISDVPIDDWYLNEIFRSVFLILRYSRSENFIRLNFVCGNVTSKSHLWQTLIFLLNRQKRLHRGDYEIWTKQKKPPKQLPSIWLNVADIWNKKLTIIRLYTVYAPLIWYSTLKEQVGIDFHETSQVYKSSCI